MTDANLGSLTKWLRILGYDTLYWRGSSDRAFLEKARKEGRIALTRKRDLGRRQFSGRLLVIETDLAMHQIREVLQAFSLRPDPSGLFTICLTCNEPLKIMGKDAAYGRVPAHVFARHTHFQVCPACKNIYWPGSHKDRTLDYLRRMEADQCP